MTKLHDDERATILAALRCWQRTIAGKTMPPEWDIANNEGTVEPLDAEGIDILCEQINTAGDITFEEG
jgi:hypothetical protein